MKVQTSLGEIWAAVPIDKEVMEEAKSGVAKKKEKKKRRAAKKSSDKSSVTVQDGAEKDGKKEQTTKTASRAGEKND